MGKAGPAPTFIATKDRNITNNTDRSKPIVTRRKHSCFEWTNLIATICIPIIIAIYTFIENNNSSSIAAASHRKDLEIANISRAAELEIAQANRLNELKIAEESRQKERDLAIDQQHENILADYQSSLAKLLIDDNSTLTKRSSMTKTVIQFMTHTALSQLDLKRKSLLILSLYDVRLITFQQSSRHEEETVLEFRQIDLSNVMFGSSHYSSDQYPLYRYIE